MKKRSKGGKGAPFGGRKSSGKGLMHSKAQKKSKSHMKSIKGTRSNSRRGKKY